MKHAEEYEAENADRIVDAEDGREDGDGRLNLALGRAGVVARSRRRRLRRRHARRRPGERPAGGPRRRAQWYAVLVLGGAVARRRGHGAGAHHPRLLASSTSPRTARRTTPALYNVATLWAALEGSILLWGLVLSGYLVATSAKFRDRLDDPLVGWALLTIFVVAAFFFVLHARSGQPVP